MIGYPSASSIIIQLEYLQNNIDELINSNKKISLKYLAAQRK